jgi:PPM family protein phosphatase
MTQQDQPDPPHLPTAIRLHSGHASDRGLRRELNEDSLVASDPVFAIADGMGGHEAGEVASGICVRTLRTHPLLASTPAAISAADLQGILTEADSAIRSITFSRAGTTASGVVLVEEMGNPYWLVFNVGDSRTYRVNQGALEQISVDHSVVQELVDAGEITAAEAFVHPRRNVVTRALGTGPVAEADFWMLPVEEGDRILLCSDGLCGEVDEGTILEILNTMNNPQDATDALIQAALRTGGRDNVSVIVIDASYSDGEVPPEADPEPGTDEVDETTIPRPVTAAAAAESNAAAGEETS